MNPDIPSFQQASVGGDNRVLSVSSLNRLARGLLEDCFPSVTVEGEISNLALPGSGHWYLTLKDDGAQIRCAMFRNRNTSVRFRPANGMQVVVRGKLSIYEGRGDYQLILDSMHDAGAGVLQRAFDELKQKLTHEGLFDAELKQPLPTHIRHVAVITSPTGAVIRDIISVFRRRFPAMQVTVLPVPVQGQEAAPAIIQALHIIERRQRELGIDVVLLARGGGSLEDLQAFNEESVARAIHACALPVVSAVGHETDITIADFVADLRAPTPSAAAELLSPDQVQLRMAVQSQQNKLVRQMQTLLNQRSQQLDWLRKRLQHPGRRLQEQSQALTQIESRLQRAMLRFLEQRRGNLQMLARNLENISPLQTLQRGYSITRTPDGELISTSSRVKPGDDIISTLATGQIVSTVKEIKA